MAREPIQPQSEADKLILESFLKHVKSSVARVTPEAVAKIEEPEDICWTWAQYLRMPLAGYALTGDPQHLDGFVQALDALLTRLSPGPGGALGFRGLPLPLFRNPDNPTVEIEVEIAEFEVAHLICDFAELVREEEALGERFGPHVERFLEVAQKHLAGPKWEERGLYVDLGEQGAIFRMPPECGNNRDSLTNPHNKQSKLCRACLALYRVTGEPEYLEKAVKLGTRFKRCVRLVDDHYLWNYWDPAGDWDRKANAPNEWKHWIGPEHRGGYHALTVMMAVELYDHGLVFDRTDVRRFLNTQMQVCWNGSVTDPVFVSTGGKPAPEPNQGTFMAPSLARFEPAIWEFCYGERAAAARLERRDHGWQGGVVAIGYLMGKYLDVRGEEPTRTRYRDQFTADAENAAFLEALQYTVQ